MLTTSQLVSIFSKAQKCDNPPQASSFIDVLKYVKPEFGMAEDGINYTCKINLLELSKSNAPEDIIYNMVEEGWILDENKKNIVNFYQ